MSGLSAEAAGADASARREVIDTSGGPLKPQHLRRSLRDPRLLPKQKPKVTSYVWPRPKKPVIIPRAEAERLFSGTLRTRNRNLRDLAIDEEQLARYGLPAWKSEDEIAQALGVPLKQLQHYSFHRQRETSPHYVTFAVPKRSGGERLIHAPKRRLKALQRRLHDLLVGRLPTSQQAHGFRPQRSVATNAAGHAAKEVVIKLDLKDCFPSISYARVRGLLISLGYGYPVAASLAVLMTEPPRQPVEAEGKVYYVPVGPRVCVQGAPTSPGLCNAVLMRLDRRLAGLAGKHGFTFTRYADDLTFSGDDRAKVKLLITIANRIVREEGFRLNRKKTRVLRRSQRQQVAGVVVNQQPAMPRRERRRLRAAVHQFVRDGGKDRAIRRRLEGRIAYLNMLNPAHAAPLRAALRGEKAS